MFYGNFENYSDHWKVNQTFSPITATIVFSPNKINIVHNIIKYLNCIYTKCFLIYRVGSINFNQIRAIAKDEYNILFLSMYNHFLWRYSKDFTLQTAIGQSIYLMLQTHLLYDHWPVTILICWKWWLLSNNNMLL